ncbi:MULTISPECIES: dihydrofolate reductase family protein [unclassified Amycolatopsis]|uniref:dihydrofolate reductase family protein n=1 Tax=unclassified Amycolatopsis TaxID=2618356 RepID=UPI002875874F|nr:MULTISPECIES: dihydrofolate reductase family protein [unclassified Amycolatopsis]MDS0138314.1 dihydrofolate reductase family protein [Amycolatopsis sp. 505]MDS0146409.1 dihydrofolate reductase family protein [Amycolatopsis sp. CM201R]
MREIVYMVHTSLDGCVEGPNGEFDWPVMGPELSAYSRGLSSRCGEFAYGRKVWDMMSAYWPAAESISDDPHDLAFAPVWRETPKVVFSRTLEKADWNTRVVGGDLTEAVASLKAEPGEDLLLMGGAELAAELTARGLIDEYQIFVHPVVLGGGKRPFAESTARLGLTLAQSRMFDDEVVLLRYRRA